MPINHHKNILKIILLLSLLFSGHSIAQSPGHVQQAIDTTKIDYRSFDNERLEQFKTDKDFDYIRPVNSQVSLFNFILLWLWDTFLRHLFGQGTMGLWEIILWLVAITFVVFIVRFFLRNNSDSIFYDGKSGNLNTAKITIDDIHRVDLEALLKEVIDKREYRNAVRLLYLISLKNLANNKHILWQAGKTNHDYERELKSEQARLSFSQLTRLYEYIWYGDFRVNPENYINISVQFSEFDKTYGAKT